MIKKQVFRAVLVGIILLSSIAFTVAAMGGITNSEKAYSGDDDTALLPAVAQKPADGKWSDVLYYNVAGVTLRPRSSNTSWESTGNCLYSPSGSELFNTPLNLPDGSVIDYLYIDYYNTSETNAEAYLSRYNNLGGYLDLVNMQTTMNGGYFSEQSSYIGNVVNSVVDNENYSYAINFRPNVNSDEMRLCGFRVAYRLP